jgi:hypothetical protein
VSALRPSELYTKIWAEDPNYGTAPSDVADTVDARIIPHMRRVFKEAPTTVIDFGAGDGRFLTLLKERGAMADGIGVDVVQPAVVPDWMTWYLKDLWAVRLPEPVDYAISTDALEHMQPGTIRGCLHAIRMAAKHGFLRISLQEDAYGTARGLHLHPSIFPAHAWLDMLHKTGIEPSSYRVYLGARRKEQALEVWF